MNKKREEKKRKREAYRTKRDELRLIHLVNKDQPLSVIRTEPRACGGCTACCTTLEIHELEKPAGQACPHACNGCAIYENRPPSCQTYWCLWQSGCLRGEENRPDKLGLMFEFREAQRRGEETSVYCAWELWEGAADQPQARKLLKRIRAQIRGKWHLGIIPYGTFTPAPSLSHTPDAAGPA